MPHPPPAAGLLVCTGKDCRHDTGFGAIMAMARSVDGASEVPCQGLCNGPVVGYRIDGELRWFTKVRSPKGRAAVAKMLHSGRVPGRLRKRESRKRRGELRSSRRVRRLNAPRPTAP